MSTGAPGPGPLIEHLKAIQYESYKNNAISITGRLLSGDRVGVAIVDTGVSLKHSGWLEQQVREVWSGDVNRGMTRTYVRPGAYPGLGPQPVPFDPDGHGTAMAELVGLPGLGVAPRAELYCYSIPSRKDPVRRTTVFTSHRPVFRALEEITKRPEIDIVNLSLGRAEPRPRRPGHHPTLSLQGQYERIVKDLMTAGKVIVMSAGNGPYLDYVTGLPGRIRQGVTVGSARLVKGHWQPSPFSLSYVLTDSSGAVIDFVPNLYAPGQQIPLRRYGHSDEAIIWAQGTSASTALTTGAAALGVEKLGRPLNFAQVTHIQEFLGSTGRPCQAEPDLPLGYVRNVLNIRAFLTKA